MPGSAGPQAVSARMIAVPAPSDVHRHPIVDATIIAGLAFALRFGIVLFSHGGPSGIYGYDSGVYYSAADALTYGRVPYSDFIFLHPPGIIVVPPMRLASRIGRGLVCRLTTFRFSTITRRSDGRASITRPCLPRSLPDRI